MTRFRFLKTRLANFWAEISLKPVTRKEYRSIGVFAALGILLMAAIAFSIDQRWQMAALIAALAIPGSLFAGALGVVIDRRPNRAKRPQPSEKPSRRRLALNVIIGVSMYLVLSHAIPSKSTLYVVLIAIAAIDYLIRRAYQRRNRAS